MIILLKRGTLLLHGVPIGLLLLFCTVLSVSSQSSWPYKKAPAKQARSMCLSPTILLFIRYH